MNESEAAATLRPFCRVHHAIGEQIKTKQKAIELAQREADKTHRTMLVLNLNPFSPLYVVREWSQRARDSRDFVAEVEPSAYL